MSEQKREHFRIIYPVSASAKIHLKKSQYAIMDISQRGIKLSVPDAVDMENWVQGHDVKANVVFLSGASVAVEGNVLRTGPDYAVLVLNEPIPLKIMYDEHRLLIQKFSVKDTAGR